MSSFTGPCPHPKSSIEEIKTSGGERLTERCNRCMHVFEFKPCGVCKTEMRDPRENRLYCSKKCCDKAYRARVKKQKQAEAATAEAKP